MTPAIQKKAIFDARLITEAPSGIGTYATEIITRLPGLAPEISFHILFRSSAVRERMLDGADLGRLPNVTSEIIGYGPFSPKSQLLMPLRLRAAGADLYHTPNFIMPFLAFPRSLRGRCKCVANIHDIIPLVVKDYAPNSRTSKFLPVYRECIRQTVMRSHAVITGSNAAKADITGELKLAGAAANRCHVIFDGALPRGGEEPHSPVKENSDSASERLLIYVGRMDPYKNVPMLVEAFSLIRQECKFPVRLKIIGPEDQRYPEARDLAERLGLGDSVEFTGFVSKEELSHCYHTADLLTHPSKYEGFGLQIIEAMSAGTPVLCTDGGSQPEVAGKAAAVVKSGDVRAFASAAVSILNSPEKQKEMRRLGLERAPSFTWDKSAEETIALYRSLLGLE